MKHGTEIIKMLEEQGIKINDQIMNTIDMLAYEIYNKGKEDGIEEGKKIGINQACREMENKIILIKSKEL
jgi:hypothetical protein